MSHAVRSTEELSSAAAFLKTQIMKRESVSISTIGLSDLQ